MKKIYVPIVLLTVLLVTSCTKETLTLPEEQTEFKYLYLGHTYESPSSIDHRLLGYLDREVYDHFWLGGDMCAETTQDFSTVQYMDNLFELSSPATHWALGNHDIRNGNVNWITDKTGRPTFYTESFNGICLLVLNTNFAQGGTYDTTSVNAQYDMIQNVCDTLLNVSHLVLLSHHVSWGSVPGIDSALTTANASYSFLKWRLAPSQNFSAAIYPLLQQVKSRGINVINVAGDYGQNETEYYEMSNDGIHFIGSGITSNIPYNEQFPTHGEPDKILIFEHDTDTQELTWRFDFL